MSTTCTHLESIVVVRPDSVPGCEDCLRIGAPWLHLRQCTACGRIGCCDSSPNRHASAHNAATGHPIIRSLEPEERWYWCYADEVGFELGD